MSRRMFIGLLVSALSRSRAFFAALGFLPHRQFNGGAGVCFQIGDTIQPMPVTHVRFPDSPRNKSAARARPWRCCLLPVAKSARRSTA